MPDPQTRPLARKAPGMRPILLAAAFPLLLLLAVGIAVSRMDLRPSLAHLDVQVLSGTAEGHYAALVDSIGRAAQKKRGHVEKILTAGAVENLARLAAASKSCEVAFGLTQAGVPLPAGANLTLVGRFPKYESLFVLGRDADKIDDFEDLRGKRIGVGPDGSGTAFVAREVFTSRDFQNLGLTLSNHGLQEQLALARDGGLDLAAFVMDEDAAFIEQAVREQGLALAGFPHADVVARRFPYLSHGRIGAGQFDPVRMLPPADKRVLRVETLLVTNGCARRSQLLGLVEAVGDVVPDFLRHNRDTPNTTGLELEPAAKDFYKAEGRELVDTYVPRLGDVMPPSNWVHVIMAVSVLFNLMGFGNRFLLWRIDANRVASEQKISLVFGPQTTLGDIARLEPAAEQLRPEVGETLEQVIGELEALAARSRKQSLSVLVPMGGEMAYRYQENLIHETLSVLRAFRARWTAARQRAGAA